MDGQKRSKLGLWHQSIASLLPSPPPPSFSLLLDTRQERSEQDRIRSSSSAHSPFFFFSKRSIWLVDLAQHLPSHSSLEHKNTELHGFDISDAQFPPAHWLPENVKLHLQDAFADCWPVKWHGRFDVVNIRFMITLLGSREAFEMLMRNVRLLLSE